MAQMVTTVERMEQRRQTPKEKVAPREPPVEAVAAAAVETVKRLEVEAPRGRVLKLRFSGLKSEPRVSLSL